MAIDEKTLADIIRGIIREELGRSECCAPGRQVDPSGVIGVDARNIELEDFPFPVDAKRVKLKDLFSVEESPRLGAGIMELDNTSLDWTLTYDEIDYVISGTLEIIIDGRKVRAEAGEVIYIPKNTSITFSSPDKARFFYAVYPANWADLV
jgi:ethanolamine utilization protein EutQ